MSEEAYGNAIDSLIQDNHLCILKAALPYLELRGQRPLSIYVKLLELKNTFSLFQQDEETLSACALQKKNGNILDLLQDIRGFCPPDRQESIDQILNFAKMYQMYQSYQSMMQEMAPQGETCENENSPAANGTAVAVEQLKSMLSPEQRNVFETYLSSI